MTARNYFLFWGFVGAAFLMLVYIFKSVLLPFVLGLGIAYLLNPLVNKLTKTGLKRGPASLLILLFFLVLVVAFLAALIPVLYKELSNLSLDLPGYIDKLSETLAPFSAQLKALIGQDGNADLKTALSQHAGQGVDVAGKVLVGVAAGGQALIGIIYLAVFMPIVAYFMMKEWPKITDWVVDLMPRDNKDTILDLLGQINRKLAGFIRGQVSVALILGVLYAVALTIAGLKYGILIGVMAGLLSVIPMVGSTIGLIAAVLVAWFQSGEWTYVLIIAAIFLGGQLLEGNFLTPKLVGKSVGLHPLWVFFALLAGGALLGPLGMLLAVPVASVVMVLSAFGIKRYKASPYYEGEKSEKKKRAL